MARKRLKLLTANGKDLQIQIGTGDLFVVGKVYTPANLLLTRVLNHVLLGLDSVYGAHRIWSFGKELPLCSGNGELHYGTQP